MLKPSEDQVPEPEDERPLGDIVQDLLEQGKAYARAEVELAKAQGLARIGELKVPAMLLFAALLFAQAAVTVLAVTIALALAPSLGPLIGGLVAMLLAGGAAALLAWLGVQRLQGGR